MSSSGLMELFVANLLLAGPLPRCRSGTSSAVSFTAPSTANAVTGVPSSAAPPSSPSTTAHSPAFPLACSASKALLLKERPPRLGILLHTVYIAVALLNNPPKPNFRQVNLSAVMCIRNLHNPRNMGVPYFSKFFASRISQRLLSFSWTGPVSLCCCSGG